MADPRADLVAELKLMRKGRGVPDPQFVERYGPALLAVLDLRQDTPVPEVRDATIELLRRLAARLPDDLTLALLVGFGVHAVAKQRFYEDRVDWLAKEVQRDKRTVKRLIDNAVEQTADLALDEVRHRAARDAVIEPSAWHCATLSTVVVLDGAAPEIIEHRRIVCHENGLDLIDLAVTLTGAPVQPGRDMAGSADLNVDVLFGGTLERTASESSRRIGLYLRLPAPLAAGDQADFMLRYRIPPNKAISPHYVAVLRYRCDHFDLRIRFGEPQPTTAYRLLSTFQADVEDPADMGEPVPVDKAGELHLVFEDLKPGFAYGARWEPLADHIVT